MANIDLTASLTSMTVIAQNKTAIYLRLPIELQRNVDGCSCQQCKANPNPAKWDTLVIPLNPEGKRDYASTHSYTAHMPDGSVQGFKDYCRRKGL